MNKETALIKKIASFEKLTDEMDGYLDDFVKLYDTDKWCRGWFKTQIAELIFEAKANSKKEE